MSLAELQDELDSKYQHTSKSRTYINVPSKEKYDEVYSEAGYLPLGSPSVSQRSVAGQINLPEQNEQDELYETPVQYVNML